MEDERRWDELEDVCLMNIFDRVEMESLLLDVPFVCKSWHRATLNPLCWQRLVFPDLTYYCSTLRERFCCQYQLDESQDFSETAFVKFIISRSKGTAVTLRLPRCASEDVLKYAADECPSLRVLVLPSDLLYKMSSTILESIVKWKNLEQLALGSSYKLELFVGHISVYSTNLCCLVVYNAHIDQDSANAIANCLPELKILFLKKAHINRDNLVTLLQGCKELERLDVSNCIGFNEDDEEITKLASHIANFCSQGSALFDQDDYDDGHISHDEMVYGCGSD